MFKRGRSMFRKRMFGKRGGIFRKKEVERDVQKKGSREVEIFRKTEGGRDISKKVGGEGGLPFL